MPIGSVYRHIDAFHHTRFEFLLSTLYFCNPMQKAYFPLMMVVLACTACEKEITVDLQSKEDRLVVEGIIEDGRFPMVTISRSLNYFSKITPAQLLESFVHDAVVTVSNGVRTHQLREYRTDTTNGIALYFYSADTAQFHTAFTGQPGNSYTLKIEVEGKTLHAVTTIPEPKLKLDSMWWMNSGNSSAEKARVLVKVTDPPERGNYVRYFTSRNGDRFLPGLNSVFDDHIVNGTTFDVPLDAGVDKNQKIDFDTYGYFKRGDTVTLKFCNVDHNTYDFWRTADFAFTATGNPFATPTRTLGNVQGALGYWGGYSVTYKTITIPK